MPFTRNVEIGRVAMVNYGPEYGKLFVISDVVDQNRALVDRPDETRHVESFKRLTLTDLKLDIPRMARKSTLNKALAANDVFAKFAATSWGRKLARRAQKEQQTDFDRFLEASAKTKRNLKVRVAFNKLKKQAK